MLIAQFNYFIWPFILLCLFNILIMLNIWKRTRKITSYKSNISKEKCRKKFNFNLNDNKNCSLNESIYSNHDQIFEINKKSLFNCNENNFIEENSKINKELKRYFTLFFFIK